MTKCDYVYIGDIDILILEDVFSVHSQIFKNCLPYSNIIRPHSKKLTGLHFTKYDEYYPIEDISKFVKEITNDEELLYKIVENNKNLYSNEVYYAILNARFDHGIHMSPNRFPFDIERPSWGISQQRVEIMLNQIKSSLFQDFYLTLSEESKVLIDSIIYLVKGISSEIFIKHL